MLSRAINQRGHPRRDGEQIRADDTKSVSDIGRIAMIGECMRSDQIGFGAHRHVITVGGHSWDPENGHTLLAAVDRASAQASCEVHRFAERAVYGDWTSVRSGCRE